MKQLLLSGFLVAALVLGACDQQSSVNSPAMPDNGSSFTKVADQLNLSMAQMGQLPEMYYLGEDLTSILTPQQFNVVNTLSTMAGDVNLADDPGDRRIPRGALDMQAMMIYRLILQANPDMTDQEKAALRAAIEASQKARMAIVMDPNLDNDTKKQMLQDEHDRLMKELFGETGTGGGLLTPDQIQKYNELRERLEQERKERLEKMLEARIDRQIAAWTKLLNLTPEQQSEIKIILKNQASEVERLRQEYKDRPDLLREELKKLQEATNALIYAELDDAQKAIWDRMHGRGGTGGGTTAIDREVAHWTKVLGLTPEQAIAFKGLLVAKQEAIQKARQEIRDPALLREELKKIEDKFNAEVLAILNDAQDAIWIKMHTPKGGGGTGNTGGIDREVEYWTKVLNLNGDQAAGLKTVLTQKQEATQKAMKEIRDPLELRKALEEINKNANAELEKIFTPEQMATWLKMHNSGGVIGRG